jgi:hypothetical protein
MDPVVYKHMSSSLSSITSDPSMIRSAGLVTEFLLIPLHAAANTSESSVASVLWRMLCTCSNVFGSAGCSPLSLAIDVICSDGYKRIKANPTNGAAVNALFLMTVLKQLSINWNCSNGSTSRSASIFFLNWCSTRYVSLFVFEFY